ncbi:MAG: c-type cytochrome [Steroidobacteraceae bacterium]|nr:c-type cytochrome [Steroidobacteraceae bacterium]
MRAAPRTFLAAACLAGVAWVAGSASAQVVKAEAGDDFRAVYATPQEISQGKRIADSSCARCHGPNGISTARGVPHLAGQRAVYLHRELLAYKKGERGKNMMAESVAFLSDDALLKVAAWYASLDPAPPAPAARTKAAAVAPDPVSAGRAAAAGCGSCHGESGISTIPGMPSLVGLDPAYLVAATNAYRNGERRHDLMKALVAGLSDADIENIALFYASQKAGRAKTPAPGNRNAGKAAAAACAGCHGANGISTGATPSLAGQDAQYFVAAMEAYRDGSRTDPLMQGPARAVDGAVLKDLAAWYASLQPQAPKLATALSVSDWVDRCDRCHGVNGNSTDPRMPALAAQRADYLEAVLNAYRTGARRSQAMSAMSKVLTEADISQLAEHYARQKARAIVYVQLPPQGNPR